MAESDPPNHGIVAAGKFRYRRAARVSGVYPRPVQRLRHSWVQAHAKELLTYLVDGSALMDEKFAAAAYESREWADFVLISPAR